MNGRIIFPPLVRTSIVTSTIPFVPRLALPIAMVISFFSQVYPHLKGQPIRKEYLGTMFKEACQAAGMVEQPGSNWAPGSGYSVATHKADSLGWRKTPLNGRLQ